jgi:hypothetical protein
LIANQHAIALNYHPEHHWMLLDPNRLPGELYLRTDLLVDAIFKAFFILKINGEFKHSLLMTISLYTQQQNQPHFMSQWNNLKNELAWIRIHSPKKTNLNRLLLNSCKNDDLNMIQDFVDQGIDVTPEIFIACCQNGSIPAANLLLRSGFNPTQALLEKIVFSDKHCPLTWGNWLITIGLTPAISLLKKALLEREDTDMATKLIDMGTVLTDTFFHDVWVHSYSPVPIDFLIDTGLQSLQTLLYKICEAGSILHAQHLMEDGIEPTEPMLTNACRRQDYNMVNLLIDRGVRLSFSALDDICRMGDTHLKALVIARDIELILWINLVNSTDLTQALNNEQSLLIARSLGDTTHLSLLQHFKRNGVQLSYHSLEYACWANKTDSVRWLLQEGVILPMDVFNSLRPSLEKNVLDLLNLNHQQKRTRYCHQPYLSLRGSAFFALPNQQPATSDIGTAIHSTFVMPK